MNTFTTRGKHVFTSEWKSLQVILKLIIRFVIRYLFHNYKLNLYSIVQNTTSHVAYA